MSTDHQKAEVRKIQFSGKSSYMLALPKKWVQEMGLGAGDAVGVEKQGDSSLIITPRVGKVFSKADAVLEVSSKSKTDSIIRRLISVYLLGYSTMQVRAKEGPLTATQRDAVKEAARRHLIGTEIIADSREGITLQVLLSYPELSVKNVLKRMFLIAESMHRDAIKALEKFDKDTAGAVTRSDDEVDRFSLYAIRQLNMAAQNDYIMREIELKTRRDCLDYRLIVKAVERVADHANKIAEGVMNLDGPVEPALVDRIMKMSEYAVGLFEQAGLALFKGDYESADQAVEEAKEAARMQEELLKMIEKEKAGDSSQVLPLVVEDIRRTAEYAADIAEIVINMNTEAIIRTEEGALVRAV
ncbi:MAG: phosphate uptake regulator PhoU [Thaumarchaeota archaeon]|nr:phosphate uptake regulator PhoU [Nitrososphaerota archaeon]